MKESLSNRTLKGFLWLSSGSGVQSVIQIGVLALLARLIVPEEFGVAQAALIVVGFANLMSQMGVGPAIVQREKLTDNHIRAAFSLSFFMGIFFGLIVYLLAGLLANFFKMPDLKLVLQVVSVLFVIESFVVVSKSLLQRKMRMKVYSIADMLSYMLGYGIVSVILGYLGYGVWALIFGTISQVLIKAAITSYAEPHSCVPFFGKKEYKELLYFGGGFTLAKFAHFFAKQGDNIVIGRFLGADSLGLYSRAYALMVKPINLIGNALDKAMFPAMASIQNEKSRLADVFLKGTSAMAFISLPMSVLLILLSHQIVFVLLGEMWLDAVLPLQILSAGVVFRMGYKMSDSLARATGLVYQRAWRQFVFAFLVIIGGIIGQNWGIAGVSVGVVLAIAINYFLMAHLSLHAVNIKWGTFLNSHVQGLLNSLIIGVPAFSSIYLFRLMELNEIITLILTPIISITVFFAFIYFLKNTFLFKSEYWIMERADKLFNKIKLK